MDQNIKTKWLAKLRDGRPQCQSVLERVDTEGNTLSQCCIGVLGEVLVEEGIIPKDKVGLTTVDLYDNDDGEQPNALVRYYGNFDNEGGVIGTTATGVLPDEYVEAIGLEGGDEYINMNDTGGSFAEIANEIEANE